MSTRTIADIEADIVALKNANPNWLTNAGNKALITSLTNEKNELSSASMQPAGNYLHTNLCSLSYFHYKYRYIIIIIIMYDVLLISWYLFYISGGEDDEGR